MLNLVLFGAPGSGKGTQSDKLTEKYGLRHISTGEVLRDHMARKTANGVIAEQYISKGNLIPDELMLQILEDELDHADNSNGVIFDGFPRTIPQAEALNALLAKRGTTLHAVVGLEVPEEDLVARLLNRGKETGRADDNEATIANRLKVYHSQTQPLKQFYSEQGCFIEINGKGAVEDIFNAITARLDAIVK
jgi:adenylate kinase